MIKCESVYGMELVLERIGVDIDVVIRQGRRIAGSTATNDERLDLITNITLNPKLNKHEYYKSNHTNNQAKRRTWPKGDAASLADHLPFAAAFQFDRSIGMASVTKTQIHDH